MKDKTSRVAMTRPIGIHEYRILHECQRYKPLSPIILLLPSALFMISSTGVEFLKDGIKEWIKDRGQQINDSLSNSTNTETSNPSVPTASTSKSNHAVGGSTAQGPVGNGLALQWVMSVIEL
ncbi:hypothetical protein PPACK8108_LOCUS9732 [Phakopsora pachyrhizi]|uniref:Uncharacterized protein n=1 Tax=Phakopsora pachyrhizi TaxID=170000 RepID=A0AAV0AZX1_PHAPC|nr:hypothetical protein PPACK8108_LOCUS9732 [Phakopsora pachyrhizi]